MLHLHTFTSITLSMEDLCLNVSSTVADGCFLVVVTQTDSPWLVFPP